MERRYFRTLLVTLTFVLVCLLAFVYMVQQPNADPDMFWRITEGNWIIEHGQVPTVDVLSWYRDDHAGHIAPQTWLFEVILAAFFDVGGYVAVYLLSAVLFAALMPLVYLWTGLRSMPPLQGLFVGVLVVLGTLQGASPRPQVVTLCLLLAVAILLERGLWKWALPLVVLGANVHGAVWPLYVLLFGFYYLPKRPLIVFAALVACTVTPDPFGILALPFAGFVNRSVGNLSEFQPLALWERPLDLVVLGLSLLLLSRVRPLPRRCASFCAVLVLLAFSGVRHVLWAYALALPLVTSHLSSEFEVMVRRQPSAVPARSERSAEAVVVATLMLGIVVGTGAALRLDLDVTRGYPAEMVEYLRANPAPRMLNRFEEGGFLMANGIEPMLDTRGQPFSDDRRDGAVLLNDYFSLVTLQTEPKRVLDRYGIEHLLLPKGSPLSIAVSDDPAFSVERADATHILYSYRP